MSASIVIAEDSGVVRAVLRQHLEEWGYRVVEAHDGHMAVEVCRAARPDAVLLDIEMPGLDGHQVLERLKADPGLADVPVVFLTGRTGTADVVEGLRLGAHDYLKKPFEPTELIARVSAAVRMKTLQDQLRARNAELDLLSRTDVLTGLHNRRHTEERLRELLASGACPGVALFDIDHFKRINDTVGHAGGDAALREFSARLRPMLRDGEVAGRWGGEEFLVVLPSSTPADALRFAEQVRHCMEAEPFTLDGGTSMPVTVSGGVAVLDGDDLEGLIRRADDALYRAKEAGRNRIEAADAPVLDPSLTGR